MTKMKTKGILLTFCLAALCACGGPSSVRTVDVTAAAPADLEEVAAGWELLPLDESETPLGSVSMVKRYGDKTFVCCRREHRFFMYEGTTLAGVLDAYGRGPGEYSGDIEDFAFRQASSELLVNDRSLPGFRIYKVPEMTWVRDEKHDFQVGTFETVDATHSLFSLEPEMDVAAGGQVQVWDHQTGAPSDQWETSFVEALTLTELFMSREPDGGILFGLTGPKTRIMRAGAKGFEPVAEVALVPDAFGPSVWEEKDFESLVEAWSAVMEKGQNVAVGAFAPLVNGEKVAFWYNTGYSSRFPFRLAVSSPEGGKAYSEVRVEGYPEPLQIVGTGEGQWCTVLQPGLLEDVPSPKGQLYPRLRELAAQGVETVLLFWSAV